MKKFLDPAQKDTAGGNSTPQYVPVEDYNALKAQVDILTKMVNAKTEVSVSAKKELPIIPKDAIQIGDKSYKWMVGIFVNPLTNLKITAEEASLDKEVLNALIAIEGQGFLVEQK